MSIFAALFSLSTRQPAPTSWMPHVRSWSAVQATLLEQSQSSQALLAQLQVQPLQPEDLLAEVVPYWSSLAEPTRAAALSFLVAEWHTLQSNERLTQLLKQLPFLPASSPGVQTLAQDQSQCTGLCWEQRASHLLVPRAVWRCIKHSTTCRTQSFMHDTWSFSMLGMGAAARPYQCQLTCSFGLQRRLEGDAQPKSCTILLSRCWPGFLLDSPSSLLLPLLHLIGSR